MSINNKFKAINGQHFIRQIFYEMNTEDKNTILYTLKDYDIELDGRAIPSIHRLYVEAEDPTEYNFANTYFDNWNHWDKIRSGVWFKPYLDSMRKELKVRMDHKAFQKIKTVAEGDTRDAFQANKYLIDKGLGDANKRGRPTKQSVIDEAKGLVKDNEDFNSDFDRMVANLDDYRKTK